MRYFIIAVAAVLAVIFVGGAVNVGGAPIFAHIDGLLGTDLFMTIHKVAFFPLYREEHSVSGGMRRTEQDLKEFEQRPLGIDRKREYQRLDDAANY